MRSSRRRQAPPEVPWLLVKGWIEALTDECQKIVTYHDAQLMQERAKKSHVRLMKSVEGDSRLVAHVKATAPPTAEPGKRLLLPSVRVAALQLDAKAIKKCNQSLLGWPMRVPKIVAEIERQQKRMMAGSVDERKTANRFLDYAMKPWSPEHLNADRVKPPPEYVVWVLWEDMHPEVQFVCWILDHTAKLVSPANENQFMKQVKRDFEINCGKHPISSRFEFTDNEAILSCLRARVESRTQLAPRDMTHKLMGAILGGKTALHQDTVRKTLTRIRRERFQNRG